MGRVKKEDVKKGSRGLLAFGRWKLLVGLYFLKDLFNSQKDVSSPINEDNKSLLKGVNIAQDSFTLSSSVNFNKPIILFNHSFFPV